jgi:Response regulator containing a CheY-like receiver domain and an HTH DNA-binding domain
MDVEMESSDAGIMAAEEIAEVLPETKIIFLTVHQDDSTIINALNAGAVDYLIKTADCKNAIEHIRQAHSDTVRMEAEIQKIMHNEYMKLAHGANDSLSFFKRLLQLTASEREIIALLLDGKKTEKLPSFALSKQKPSKNKLA